MQLLVISRQKSSAHGQESFKILFLVSDPLLLHALYSYSSTVYYVRSCFISNSTHTCAPPHVATKAHYKLYKLIPRPSFQFKLLACIAERLGDDNEQWTAKHVEGSGWDREGILVCRGCQKPLNL